jgi:hypothetical protein
MNGPGGVAREWRAIAVRFGPKAARDPHARRRISIAAHEKTMYPLRYDRDKSRKKAHLNLEYINETRERQSVIMGF